MLSGTRTSRHGSTRGPRADVPVCTGITAQGVRIGNPRYLARTAARRRRAPAAVRGAGRWPSRRCDRCRRRQQFLATSVDPEGDSPQLELFPCRLHHLDDLECQRISHRRAAIDASRCGQGRGRRRRRRSRFRILCDCSATRQGQRHSGCTGNREMAPISDDSDSVGGHETRPYPPPPAAPWLTQSSPAVSSSSSRPSSSVRR